MINNKGDYMKINELIEQLNKIKDEYGDIEVYQSSTDYDNYGCLEYYIDTFSKRLKPSKLYVTEYESEYYCHIAQDEVKDVITEICEAQLDEEIPSDAKLVHVGLIL